MSSQNHEWSAFHAIWNQGRNDKWMAVQYPEAMGYFKRGDIPYYYALADAFTLCEAYYQSMMGPTNPNRLYHMSGRAAPAATAETYTSATTWATAPSAPAARWTGPPIPSG